LIHGHHAGNLEKQLRIISLRCAQRRDDRARTGVASC